MLLNETLVNAGLTSTDVERPRFVLNRDNRGAFGWIAAFIVGFIIGCAAQPQLGLSASFRGEVSGFQQFYSLSRDQALLNLPVRIHGTVLCYDASSLLRESASRKLCDLLPGSLLRITGVCSVQGDERHQANAFRLLLALASDVEFLGAPPRWTGRNFLMLIGGTAALLVAGLAWVASLRRQVRRQTAAIHEEKNLLATLIDHLTDKALRVSEQRFRAIWEHSIDGMRLTDHEGRIIAVNEAFCQLVKLAREKLVGELFSVAYRNEGEAGSLETYLKGFRAGKLVPRTTARIRFWNGEDKDVEVSSCFVDLGREDRTVLSIFRDISERRRVESVLAYERDLLTTLFDNLPDALYFKDLQSRFVRVSRSKLDSSWAMALTRHRFATTKETLPVESHSVACKPDAIEAAPAHLASREAFAEYIIGKTDFDFFDETRARSAFEDEQQIIRTGKPLIGKVEQTNHLDGRVTWSLSTKMPWLDKDGRLIGTFGVSKDITPLKEAEASVELVHKQLLEASRQAGMAEVATGVLHNVGNVLNSVNVSATLLSEKLRYSRTSSLAKVAALLREHAPRLGEFMTNDSRGRQLPLYLEQLAERLAAEQASLLGEVGCLAKNVEHIKSIVAMQQSYARPAGVTELVQPVDVVEDALRINGSTLARCDVQIIREYESHLASLTLDKHKVLQILINLVSNAGHACAQSAQDEKCLTVSLATVPGRLKISISDNGVGIAPENLTRIFSLGFTTRPDGHGFGLHSGALAAREIGGTLSSHSDGPGLGATFVLELPLVS